MEPSPKKFTRYGLDASKYPSRAGAPWKDEELIQLLTSVKNKESIQEIAKKHSRTEGGIISRLRYLAAEYYVNDDKSIEEIKVITGLDKESIIDAIQRREWADSQKEKKASQKNQLQQFETEQKVKNIVPTYPTSTPNPPVYLDNDRDVILMTLALVVKLHEKVDYLTSKIL
jgi:hypothetical protein